MVNGVGKSSKIIDMSTCLFCQQKYNVLAAVHAFSGNDNVPVFFGKVKNVMWKLVLQMDEFLDAYSQLGLFNPLNANPTKRPNTPKQFVGVWPFC